MLGARAVQPVADVAKTCSREIKHKEETPKKETDGDEREEAAWPACHRASNGESMAQLQVVGCRATKCGRLIHRSVIGS